MKLCDLHMHPLGIPESRVPSQQQVLPAPERGNAHAEDTGWRLAELKLRYGEPPLCGASPVWGSVDHRWGPSKCLLSFYPTHACLLWMDGYYAHYPHLYLTKSPPLEHGTPWTV